MAGARPRLLLLLPSTTYRAGAFVEAARQLDLELTVASERTGVLADREPANLLQLDLGHPSRAAAETMAFAQRHPVAAVFGVDDDTAVAAAAIADALDLPHAPQRALEAARDKLRQRVMLHTAGVPVPGFADHPIEGDVEAASRIAPFPCVLKPLVLSASRGVIRADSPTEFREAHARLSRIVADADVARHGEAARRYLVEAFVPGPEFALEGLMVDGRLHTLALFDKPDALDGPFFEETIYVTPSRLPTEVQRDLVACAEAAARAIGLLRGPVHVELRHNSRGPWLIELAGRPIGGRCGQVLRFGAQAASLEAVLLGHAVGRVPPVPGREALAAGVLMIPIPRAGIFSEIRGASRAASVEGIAGIEVTAVPGRRLVPLPEGSQYLGFVFARGATPQRVEQALRGAQEALEVVIEPEE
jgi:D-alanine-D-alanine ligase-like ATP-grasp enzyme